MTIFEKIISLLAESKVWYELLEHEPVYTSQQASAVRPDISLHQGAKAMVLKNQNSKIPSARELQGEAKDQNDRNDRGGFFMVVVPGDRKIDYRKVSQHLGIRDCALALAEEVERVIGVKVGAVSPLGNLSGLKVLVDQSLLASEVIAFNAGDHSKTVVMKSRDYLDLSEGQAGDFSK